MAEIKLSLFLCFLAIWAFDYAHCASHQAPAPSVDCSSLILSMADCLSFVSNGSTVTKPEGTCCNGLRTVLKVDAACLCESFKSSAQRGVVLNVTKAVTLPAACKVSASSVPNCALSVTPAAAPGARARAPESARVTITNNCKETIWPGVIPGENFDGGGFVLKPGKSINFTAPVGWSGRIWGRTGCNFDKNGNGNCTTGDCGSTLKCSASGKPPISLAEFTLAAASDFYDVSLVDGFNLPMVVTPIHGKGNCSIAGCDRDLRADCPKELSVKANGNTTIACRSACDVFNTDEYCCRGVYGNSVTCQPTYYSKKFKSACPTAYTYPYDDPTSVFTCSGTDYVVAFCFSSGSEGLKSLTERWWVLMIAAVLLMIGSNNIS